MATMTRFRAAIATAAFMLVAAVAAPALAQAHSHTSGGMHTIPGFQRSTSSGPRMSLPQIRMGDWGVRSEAPRGIGKVGGPLVPPPVHNRPHATGVPDNDGHVTGGGGLVHGRNDAGRPAPWVGQDGAFAHVGAGGVQGAVVNTSDHWKFAAALNPGLDHTWHNNRHHWNNWGHFNNGWYYPGVGAGYGSYFSDGWYPSTYGYEPGYYVDPFIAPPAPESVVDPEANLTVPERGALRLQRGKTESAIALLRSYTESNPADDDAARTLALALLDARRTKEGIAVMALVYERNPRLAWSPLAPDVVGPSQDLRALLVRVVEYGHRTNTASAWLTAAILMQGEGREAPALKMLDRADALGLDADLSRSMRQALKP